MAPPVEATGFGGPDTEDLLAAIAFLRSLKGYGQSSLVGQNVGAYGVEMGAYTALRAASQDARIQVLVLDSIPRDQDELVDASVIGDVGVNNSFLLWLARLAIRAYFAGEYENKSSCELVKTLKAQRILLLAGADNTPYRDSTASLAQCFPNPANLEAKIDLPLTGFTLSSATGEQGEAYDRPVIDFFSKSLQ
jgi:hypothetical protein